MVIFSVPYISVCLQDSVLAFHRHGMQGRSFKANEVNRVSLTHSLLSFSSLKNHCVLVIFLEHRWGYAVGDRSGRSSGGGGVLWGSCVVSGVSLQSCHRDLLSIHYPFPFQFSILGNEFFYKKRCLSFLYLFILEKLSYIEILIKNNQFVFENKFRRNRHERIVLLLITV